jgi:endoribonuclease Dicer
MPEYIQSKVFAYKGWHPPNFRIYVPPKVAKDTEKEVQQLEPGEIIEEPKEDDNTTARRNTNLEPSSDGEQTMDVEEDTHLDEDSIQEQLLPCSLEPVELEEAVVEPDTNEGVPPSDLVNISMNEEEMHHTGDAEDEPLGEEKTEEGNEADVETKQDSGVEAKIDAEESREQASATDKTEPSKKPKPKKKKSASEEGIQSLGDKVSR